MIRLFLLSLLFSFAQAEEAFFLESIKPRAKASMTFLQTGDLKATANALVSEDGIRDLIVSVASAGILKGTNLAALEGTDLWSHLKSQGISTAVQGVLDVVVRGEALGKVLEHSLRTLPIQALQAYGCSQIGELFTNGKLTDLGKKALHGALGGITNVMLVGNRDGFVPGALASIAATCAFDALVDEKAVKQKSIDYQREAEAQGITDPKAQTAYAQEKILLYFDQQIKAAKLVGGAAGGIFFTKAQAEGAIQVAGTTIDNNCVKGLLKKTEETVEWSHGHHQLEAFCEQNPDAKEAITFLKNLKKSHKKLYGSYEGLVAEAPWFDENGFEEGDTFPDLNKHERGDHALGHFLDAVGEVKTLLVEGIKDTIPETIQDLAGKTLEKLLPLAQKVIERALEGVEVYGKGVQQYGGNTPPGSPRQRSQQMFQVDGEKGLQEIGLRTGQVFDQAASTLNLTPDQLDNAVFVFTLGTGGIGKNIGKKLFTQEVTKTTTKQVVKNAPKKAVQETKKLLPGEGKVGTYGELKKISKPGDNLTPNHMPQSAYMKKQGVTHNDGVAMMMEHPYPGTGGRHRETRTYGKKPDTTTNARQELAKDIQDAKNIYKKDGLYTPEIQEGLKDVIKQNKESFPHLFEKKK